MTLPRILCMLPCLWLWACSSQSDDVAYTAETKMFETTQTYCFGRFLVDVPREAVLKTQGYAYYAESIKSGRGAEEYHAKIKDVLEERKKETSEGGLKYVRSEYPDGENNQIIVSKMTVIGGEILLGMDVFALRQGVYFYLAVDGRSEDAVEEYIKTYRESILPALRYRPEYDIPREPGFCFQDGFIASDGGGYVDSDGKRYTAEEASLAFTLKDHPDVWIRISSRVYFVPREPLLVRYNQGDLGDHRVRRDSIRKREAGGMQGDEMLLSGTLDGNVSYLYKWEALGEIKNPLKPGLTLDIRAGEPVGGELFSSSLEKAQVRALYEKVLNSIRPRPVEAPKPVAAAPENVPPRLATGALCPRTGHWRCLEDGKTLSLVEGQRMPYFLLPHPAPGWRNWLRGIKNTYTNETGHWEWVGEKKADGGNG